MESLCSISKTNFFIIIYTPPATSGGSTLSIFTINDKLEPALAGEITTKLKLTNIGNSRIAKASMVDHPSIKIEDIFFNDIDNDGVKELIEEVGTFDKDQDAEVIQTTSYKFVNGKFNKFKTANKVSVSEN